MAANRQRKAAVRARMERTGESYQTAHLGARLQLVYTADEHR